jgi:formate hydrogenlyase transcriptional activator
VFVTSSSVHRLDRLFGITDGLGLETLLRTGAACVAEVPFQNPTYLAACPQNVQLTPYESDPEELGRPGGETSSDEQGLLLAAYSSTVGLGIIDRSFRYIWVNEKLARMHNRPVRDHIGNRVRDILGDLADVKEPHLRRVIQTGEPVLNVDITGVLAGKDPVFWRQHYFPLKDAAGKVTRIGITSTELAAKAAQGVEKELSIEKDRRQILAEIGKLLASNWDLPTVFPTISARLRRLFQQEYASFSLYDSEAQIFVRQGIDFPFGKGLLATTPFGVKNSPAQTILERQEPLILSRKDLERYDAEITKSLLAEGMQSVCCVPMMRPSGPMGMLVLGSTRDRAFEAGDVDLLSQVAAQVALALENHHAAAEIQKLRNQLEQERQYLKHEVKTNKLFPEIVGDSPALRQVLEEAITVAESEATVLILGETGTGKELIARAIHRLSRRQGGPFVKLNCAAIPTGLLESELFGHEKGAFTGAISQKVGRMELADGGTLFLDEVGEISLELQPKLLRVLQDQEFERLGSNRTIKVNVRLIAATNRNLAERVEEGEFRDDLYYRLSVFPITVPPLRQRQGDIPLLVRHFVSRFAKRMNRHIEGIPKSTMDALQKWDWPGNIRELENLVERAVILTRGRSLRVPLPKQDDTTSEEGEFADNSLQQAERQHIIRVLKETRGVLSGPNGAARRLGLKRTTLQSKMQRLKIRREDYSESPEN